MDIAKAGPGHIIDGNIFSASSFFIIFFSTIVFSIFAPTGYPATIEIKNVKGKIKLFGIVEIKPELTIIIHIQHIGKRDGMIDFPQVIMVCWSASLMSRE